MCDGRLKKRGDRCDVQLKYENHKNDEKPPPPCKSKEIIIHEKNWHCKRCRDQDTDDDNEHVKHEDAVNPTAPTLPKRERKEGQGSGKGKRKRTERNDDDSTAPNTTDSE